MTNIVRSHRELDILEHDHCAESRGERELAAKMHAEPELCIKVLDCVATLCSKLDLFEGHLDIRCMLLPIERYPGRCIGEYHRSTRGRSVSTIKLAHSGKSNRHECDMLSAASPGAAAFILNDDCFWMPVYYANRRHQGSHRPTRSRW